MSLQTTNLVPTIPLRLNYLLWLQDLVGLWAPRVKVAAEGENFSLKDALLLQQQQKDTYQQQPETAEQQQQESNQQHFEDTPAQVQSKNKRLEKTEYVNPVIGIDIG